MRIWSVVCGVIGVASTCAEVGHSFGDVSSEKPLTNRADGSCNDWTAWVPQSTKPAIVMQVVSIGFMPMEKNFIRLMEANSRFSRDNIYLLCLDEESERVIATMGFPCVPAVHHLKQRRFHFIWKLRVKVLSCLLEAGHDVILSDSDALWLKDPIPDFDSPLVRGSSIVASRGNFPFDIRILWGSTLCMGFILFRAGACIETVLTSMNRLVAKTGDDQKSINYAGRELGLNWDRSSDMNSSSTDFSRGIISNRGRCDLNVTLLPQNKYTRYCEDSPITPITVVAHCHARQGRSSVKSKWMMEVGLWDVDDSTEIEHGKVQAAKASKYHPSSTTESLGMPQSGI